MGKLQEKWRECEITELATDQRDILVWQEGLRERKNSAHALDILVCETFYNNPSPNLSHVLRPAKHVNTKKL